MGPKLLLVRLIFMLCRVYNHPLQHPHPNPNKQQHQKKQVHMCADATCTVLMHIRWSGEEVGASLDKYIDEGEGADAGVLRNTTDIVVVDCEPGRYGCTDATALKLEDCFETVLGPGA